MLKIIFERRLLIKFFFYLMLLCSLGCSNTIAFAGVKAFPGAEGFGTNTVHGRGGKVIHVTNLKNSGPGSFRAACEASGRRIVVFDVSGIISLGRDPIVINNPFIYIAGQTAPGDGICLKNSGIRVHTHDVLIRYIRIRPGDGTSGTAPRDRDAISVLGNNNGRNSYNVVIDHCSMSWAIDEVLSTWHPGIHDITFSWNIISEGLWHSRHPEGSHSRGLLIGDGARDISIHHNYLAHHNRRTPLIKGSTNVDVVNNLIYNPREFAASIQPVPGYDLTVNFVKNYYKAGWNRNHPAAHPADVSNYITKWEIDVFDKYPWSSRSGVYHKGNIGWRRTNDSQEEYVGSEVQANHRSSTRYSAPAISTRSALDAKELILRGAGATAPKRDSVDTRVVADFKNGTGKIINSQREVGGWPIYRSATLPRDTDRDGMSDNWENNHGLNPQDPSDASRDKNNNGYTNIEEYVNSLASSPSVNPPGSFSGRFLLLSD